MLKALVYHPPDLLPVTSPISLTQRTLLIKEGTLFLFYCCFFFIYFFKETTITDPCHETLDVGFVIDASGSVGMDTFSREKNFVKLVSRRFAATSPNTRLGLLVFSDTPKLFVDFADYESKTIEQFQANVAQATFQDGRSRIDLALRAASQDFFTNRRSGVPRVSKKNKESL